MNRTALAGLLERIAEVLAVGPWTKDAIRWAYKNKKSLAWLFAVVTSEKRLWWLVVDKTNKIIVEEEEQPKWADDADVEKVYDFKDSGTSLELIPSDVIHVVEKWMKDHERQETLPAVKDVPQDWSRWTPPSNYEALNDDSLPLEPSEREALENVREEHIDTTLEFIAKAVTSFEQTASTDYAPEGEEQINELDSNSIIAVLDNWAHRRRDDLAAEWQRSRQLDVDKQLVVDLVKARANYFQGREGLVLDTIEISEQEMDIRDWLSHVIEDFDELLQGLGMDELEEVAKRLRKNSSATWTPETRKNKIGGTLSIDFGLTFYTCVNDISALADALEELNNEREDQINDQTGGSDTGHLAKPVVKQLPAGLSADQLALLRMFELRGTDQIPSQELRKLPLAKIPYVKDLLDRNKILTPDIIKQTPAPQPVEALQRIQANQKLFIKPFTMNIQVIWDGKDNNAFIVAIPVEKFQETFGMPMPRLVAAYIKNTNHPNAGQNNLTIGWVRFTEFDNDIWIDEIQSDLSDKMSSDKLPPADIEQLNAFLETLGGMTALSRYISEQFIREMRARGYEKFYLPSLQIKKSLYRADPPKSIYEDLPKKLRMQPVEFSDTELGKTLNGWKPLLDGVWRAGVGRYIVHETATQGPAAHPARYVMFGEDIRSFGEPLILSDAKAAEWFDLTDAPPTKIKWEELPTSAKRGYAHWSARQSGTNIGIVPSWESVWVLATTKVQTIEAMADVLDRH